MRWTIVCATIQSKVDISILHWINSMKWGWHVVKCRFQRVHYGDGASLEISLYCMHKLMCFWRFFDDGKLVELHVWLITMTQCEIVVMSYAKQDFCSVIFFEYNWHIASELHCILYIFVFNRAVMTFTQTEFAYCPPSSSPQSIII